MDTGCIPQLSDPSVSVEEKHTVIDERVAMHGFQRGNVIGLDGISIFDGKDYSDREYVQQAMAGNIYVVVERDTDRADQDQGDDNGCHQADGDLFTNTLHISPLQFFSITLNYKNTVATVDQMLSETAVLAAERIEQELTAYKNVAFWCVFWRKP